MYQEIASLGVQHSNTVVEWKLMKRKNTISLMVNPFTQPNRVWADVRIVGMVLGTKRRESPKRIKEFS